MTARLVLCASLTMAIVGTQDAPTTRQLAVTLEEYVHAGLTPFQALQAATVNAA